MKSPERLREWLDELDPILARLRDWLLPDDFPFDYSASSLGELERILLAEAPERYTPLVESAAAYVGEALLRAGGGEWAWDDVDDLPVVRLDKVLDLSPIAPMRLVLMALRTRGGTEFTAAHEAVRRAAGHHPDWQPRTPERPPDDWLAGWLADREAGFSAWLRRYDADPARWDFSVHSLEVLENLALRTVPGPDDFAEAGYDDFTQGAVWYLGEIAHRGREDVVWKYNPVPPEMDKNTNPWAGQPYVWQQTDETGVVPVLALEILVEDQKPGTLRELFARFLPE